MAVNMNRECAEHQRHPAPRAGNRCATCSRIRLERKIVLHVVDELLRAGFAISVNDGEETTLHHSLDKADVKAALFSTDEDWLLVNNQAASVRGRVGFSYGNEGYDVISDYTVNLEPWLKPINDWVDELEPG